MSQRKETTTWALCREWRQTYHKQQYEAAMVGDDDDAVDRAVDATEALMRGLEGRIAASVIATTDEAQAVLSVALALLRNHGNESRAIPLISAVHRGLNIIRNDAERRSA